MIESIMANWEIWVIVILIFSFFVIMFRFAWKLAT